MTHIIRRMNGNFTVVQNSIVNDERLSLEAIGLLTWLLSKPDNWRVIQNHIGAVFKIGRDKVRRLINELIECGYLQRQTVRDEAGEFVGVDYIIYDSHPMTENPAPDNPAPVKPTPDNKALVKKEREQILKGTPEAPQKPTTSPVPEPIPKPQTDTDAQFEALKAEYPRRKTDQGWGEARRAFSQALKRSSFETIVAGARAYAAHCKANGNAGTDYVHKLRTFLANDKWDDFLGQTEAAEWQRRLAAARRMASWDTKWGPMPGQPGCLAPAALLQPGDGVGWQIWIPAAA